MPPIRTRSLLRGDSLAFVTVVLAGFLVQITSGVLPFSSPLFVTNLLLGLVYLGLGLLNSAYDEWFEPLPRKLIYLLVQMTLAALINYFSRGAAWLIMLPLVSTALQDFPRPWAVLICAVLWAIDMFPIVLDGGWSMLLAWGMPVLAAIVFVAAFTQLIISEQKARSELAAANQKLRDYAAKAEELAVAQERNRLAREIHDGLGHYLTAINIQIRAAQATLGQDRSLAEAALNNAHRLTGDALNDVRRSITALRADPTTERPLPERIQDLLSELRAAGIEPDFKVEGAPRPLAPQVELALFRAAQEGLTNVRKHSAANRVSLLLGYTPTGARLTVQDNGRGAVQVDGGFGLSGLQERLELLGGQVTVETAPESGFKLIVDVPDSAAATPPED